MTRDLVYNIKTQLENAKPTEEGIKRIDNALKSMSSNSKQAESATNKLATNMQRNFQRAGSAIYALSSAFSTLVSAMQSIASFGPGGVLTRGLSQLSSMVSTSFYSGLEAGVTRFDTMKTFPQLVEGMGLGTAADAEKVVNKLDMAVRGLPTSLDEITSSAKDLMSITGDVNEAGDLAIAINNAILASGATEQQKYFATAQLRDLISVGKLTDREWVSLSKSIPLAMGKIARSFNLKNWKELQQAVDDGSISVEQFKEKLVELGTGEGIFVELANIQKTTISGLRANITNAVSRLIGGKNGILTIADEFSKRFLGANSLVEYLYGLTTWIDKLGESMRKFAFENSDRILKFIDRFTQYDWAKFVGTFFDFSLKKMETWLKAMEVFGPRLEAIALSWGNIITRILGSIASVGTYLAGFWGLQRLLGSAGGAAGAAGAVAGAGGAAGAVGVFSGIGSLLTGFVAAFKPVLVAGGITAIISGFALLDSWMIKNAFKNIRSITTNVIGIINDVKTAASDLKNVKISSLDKVGDLVEFVRKFYAQFTDDKILDIGFWDVDGQIGVKESNNISTIVENMANVISSIVKSARKISNVKLPSRIRIDNFKDFFKDISELMVWLYDLRASDQFGNAGEGQRIFSGKKFKAIEASMNNVKGVIDSIAQMVTTVHDMVDTLKFLFTTDKEHGSTKIREKNALETRIQWMLEDIFGVANFIQDVFEGRVELSYQQPNGKGGFTTRTYHVNDLGNIQKDLSSMEGIISSIAGFVNTVHGMVDTLKFLFTTDKTHGSTQVREKNALENRVAWMLEDIFGVVAYIQDVFEHRREFTFRKLDSKGKWVTATATIDDLKVTDKSLSTVGNMITSIGGFVEGVDSMVGRLTHLFTRGKNSENTRMENLAKRLTEFLGRINTIFSTVELFKFERYEDIDLSGATAVLENIESMIASLDGVRAVIPDEKTKETLVNTASYLGDVLDELWKALNFGEEVNVDNAGAMATAWASMLEQIDTLIGKLSSAQVMLSDNSVYEASKKIRKELERLRQAIDKTSEKIKSIGTSWTDGIVNALDAGRVADAIDTVIAQFVWDDGSIYMSGYSKGLSFIQGLRDALGFTGGVGSIGTSTVLNILNDSQGGVVYRAFGGDIFKPKGTDTVPAMLTPGEYVTRRSAVDAVGKEFMDRVNALDFRGALTALSKRVGMGMIPGISQSFAFTSNETTNHNGTINFYTTTNNPDYPHQVSGKWIRKLV